MKQQLKDQVVLKEKVNFIELTDREKRIYEAGKESGSGTLLNSWPMAVLLILVYAIIFGIGYFCGH